MCQQQICLSDATYMPHAHITQHASMEEVWQCMYHIQLTGKTVWLAVLYTYDNNANDNADADISDGNATRLH